MRSPHTFAYLISCFLIKIGFYRIVFNPFGGKKKLPAVHINRALRLFWSITEFAGVVPIILLRAHIPMKLGYAVIAERCLVDTIVNIAYHIGDIGFLHGRMARVLIYLFPRKTLFIYFDSNYKTLVERRGKNVEAYSLIKFQRDCYKLMEKMLNATRIDTSNHDVNQTSNIIKELIKKEMHTSVAL